MAKEKYIPQLFDYIESCLEENENNKDPSFLEWKWKMMGDKEYQIWKVERWKNPLYREWKKSL